MDERQRFIEFDTPKELHRIYLLRTKDGDRYLIT